MPSTIQRSFSAGEISPSLYGRADVTYYQTGLRTCRNFWVQKHGGVANRPGFEFIAETKDSSKASRLIPWQFNADQTYVLEFGDQYIRVYRDGAQIVPGTVTAWNSGTDYVAGNLASSGGVNYYCILGHTNHTPPNSTYWYPLPTGVFEIPSPYVEADLFALQYVQSADIVTIVHPNYAPRELRRTGHTAWTLGVVAFTPTIGTPANAVATRGGAGSNTYKYKVTAIAQDNLREGLPSAIATVTSAALPTDANPVVITWDAVSGAQEYDVYKELNGVYGFIGVAGASPFNDTNIVPDTSQTPPIARNPFNAAGDYPSAVSYIQQRLALGGTDNNPETIWLSRTGDFYDFSIRSPLQDDDSCEFALVGRQVNAIKHVMEIARPVVLTSGGEWTLEGNQGAITPSSPGARLYSHRGSASIPPQVIGETAIYLQARGSVVRDLAYSIESDGYTGNDLTVQSYHLFDGHTLVDWCYQQTPHSIVWAVRDDGTLLSLTYLREHKIAGWARHDTGDGDSFESVACVAEGEDDVVYAIVNREVDGSNVRYVERMARRRIDDLEADAKFLDSFLSYDGRNTSGVTMTVSGGTTWAYTETLTLTASGAHFSADDVGDAIVLGRGTETEVKLTITAYTSSTVVSVKPNKTVPLARRAAATADWAHAIASLAGLDHLEGRTVSILADGSVAPQAVVTDGEAALQSPAVVVHAGLPITADFGTLSLDSAQQPSLDIKKRINRISLLVEASRGIKAGRDESSLIEYKQRAAEGYGQPIAVTTDVVEIPISGRWENTGRILVRQADPLPLTILAAIPAGDMGG
jgi:hypothetical protein